MMRTFDLHRNAAWPVMAYEWLPKFGEVRGCVHLFHGMTEYLGNYQEVALALVSAGFAVYGLDLRGHGLSAGPRLGELTLDENWEDWLCDLHALRLYSRQQFPSVPAFALGHSMGSYLVQDYVSRCTLDFSGVILFGSSLENRFQIGTGYWISLILGKILGETLSGKLIYHLIYGGLNRPFKPARTLFDWLSRDSNVVDSYILDPKCGFIPPIRYYQVFLLGLYRMLSARPWTGIPAAIPVAIFSGAEDSLGKFTRSVLKLATLYKEAGHEVSTYIYPGARHVLFAELNKNEVIQDLILWLTKRSALA